MENVETVEVAVKKNPVVLVQQQQKPRTVQADFNGYTSLTNEELHQEVLAASASLQKRCIEAYQYAEDAVAQPLAVLVPLCYEIVARFKMQGVAAKDRPNGQPTVEAYFRSISLNYNTVRSWFRRERLRMHCFEMFLPDKPKRLTPLAKASHDVIEARKNGGDVDAAIKHLEAAAPPIPDFDEEDIEPPKEEKLPSLALRLVKEIESFFDGSSMPKMPEKLKTTLDKLKVELDPKRGVQHQPTTKRSRPVEAD